MRAIKWGLGWLALFGVAALGGYGLLILVFGGG